MSVNNLTMGVDWGVPVGVDAAVTTVVVGVSLAAGVLPPLAIKAKSWLRADSSAELLPPVVEPELGETAYKIQSESGNHFLGATTADTHRIPAELHASLTGSNRRSIRHGCKQKSETSHRFVVWEWNPLEKSAKNAKKRAVKAVQRIL
jgi:hypothetical protein